MVQVLFTHYIIQKKSHRYLSKVGHIAGVFYLYVLEIIDDLAYIGVLVFIGIK